MGHFLTFFDVIKMNPGKIRAPSVLKGRENNGCSFRRHHLLMVVSDFSGA